MHLLKALAALSTLSTLAAASALVEAYFDNSCTLPRKGIVFPVGDGQSRCKRASTAHSIRVVRRGTLCQVTTWSDLECQGTESSPILPEDKCVSGSYRSVLINCAGQGP